MFLVILGYYEVLNTIMKKEHIATSVLTGMTVNEY